MAKPAWAVSWGLMMAGCPAADVVGARLAHEQRYFAANLYNGERLPVRPHEVKDSGWGWLGTENANNTWKIIYEMIYELSDGSPVLFYTASPFQADAYGRLVTVDPGHWYRFKLDTAKTAWIYEKSDHNSYPMVSGGRLIWTDTDLFLAGDPDTYVMPASDPVPVWDRVYP